MIIDGAPHESYVGKTLPLMSVLLQQGGQQYNDRPHITCEGLVVPCMRCTSERTRKDGQTPLGGRRWRCNDCQHRFTARSTTAFTHHAFAADVIA